MSSHDDPQVIETWRMNADFLITDLETILRKLSNIDNAVGLDPKNRMRLQSCSNHLTDLASEPQRSAAE